MRCGPFDEKLTDDPRQAGRLMTSVYADHEASMAWQAIMARTGLPPWPGRWNTAAATGR